MIVPNLTQVTSSFFDSKTIGTGNALFQIFTAYGLAKKYNHTFNNYNLLQYLIAIKKFNYKHDSTIFRNLKIWKTIPNNICNKVIEDHNKYELLDENICNIVKNTNDSQVLLLIGYFQSHLYFDEYYNEIKQLLSPDENSIKLIRNKYTHLFDENNINISLHFRMNWAKNITYNFNFYYEAIDYIVESIKSSKNIIINIFADDVDIVKQKFSSKYNTVYFEDNEDYIDLWSMTLCDHNILSHSTLCWWGAYLNLHAEKIVVYPDDVCRLVGADLLDNKVILERKTQHYKEEWISLNTKNVLYISN